MATTTVTTVNRRTDLVDTQSLTYIRAITLTIKVSNCKPLTRLYPFFDGYAVDDLIEQSSTIDGVPAITLNPLTGNTEHNVGNGIVTDSSGSCTLFFYIPGFRFTTGKKKFVLSESKVYIPGENAILGSTYGFATGIFTSNGVKEFYQETVTTVNDVTIENVSYQTIEIHEQPWRPNVDPVAQSFSTFGTAGGCFVTGVDVYFSAKDTAIPVTLELREMVNGYPGPRLLSSYGRKTLNPGQVSVSANASLATTFKFDNMVYLLEDMEYCFVLITNSTKYDVFSAVMGEYSLETGKRVFEQTQTGSLFKSQNNSTWTADQFEDLKFKINVAEFNTSTAATLPLIGTAAPISILSDMLQTTNGSNIISVKLTYRHGLEVDSKIKIAVNPTGTYNGISAIDLIGADYGNWSVTAIVSEYEFEFAIGVTATSTGPIIHGTTVRTIHVDTGGSGYTTAPTVSIIGTGSGAVATATVRDGVVTDIVLTNAGSGYTTAPTVSIIGSPGLGATATAVIDSMFTIVTNRLAHSITPVIPNFVPTGTNIRATLKPTLANYTNGGITTYTNGESVLLDLNARNDVNQNIVVASKTNEVYKMSGNNSTQLEVVMTSNNKNVSPVIDISTASLLMTSNNVNSQFNEVTDTTTNAYGTVDSIVISSGGSGYVSAPAVTIVAAPKDNGSGATATATLTGGVVTGITITNAGSGYVTPPSVHFAGASTTVAVANTTLSDFNTELTPYSGRGFSRYLTGINNLETVSKGVRIIVNAYSSNNTSFDFYIRTSLSSESVNHVDKNWTILTCDVARNASRNKSEVVDYTFYNNNLPPFDAFDLKIVLKTKVPYDVPVIHNYRAAIIV